MILMHKIYLINLTFDLIKAIFHLTFNNIIKKKRLFDESIRKPKKYWKSLEKIEALEILLQNFKPPQ